MKNFSQRNVKAYTVLALTALIAVLVESCKKNNIVNSPTFRSSASLSLPSSLPNTLSNGLVAYWTCANTTYDLSGNGHNCTLNSISSTSDRFGHSIGAFSFNGTSSNISVADAAALRLSDTSFTLNAWVKLNSYNPSASIIMGKRVVGVGNSGWSWGVTSGGVINYSPGTSPNGIGTGTISLSTWHMVTSVYSYNNSQTLSIYIDGVLDHSITGVSQANASTTALLYIGSDNPNVIDNGYFLDGALNDLRIYNRAITTTEITALYNATTAPTDGLVAYWPLTNTADDLSGNGYHGTANSVSTTTDRFGNPIGAYSFNGTSSNISVADAAALRLSDTSFTLNAWVKLNSYNPSASIIMGKRVVGVGNSGWSWGVTSGGVINYSPGTSPNGTGTGTISLSTWHMVTSVYSYNNSQTLSIYIDGVLDHSITGVSQANASTTALLYIGSDNPNVIDNGYFLDGALNDLRIYNRAITTTEINQLYNALN